MDIAASTDAFVAKYNGTHIDEDGYYGAQCWDVVARFAREVVGCPSFPTGSGGAEGLYRLFQNPIPQYFDRIANDPNDKNQVPQKGDIIVYQGAFSPPWGHTALVISATSSSIKVLEQNGNVPGGNAYIKDRGYNLIYGWLRPKGGSMGEQPIGDGDTGILRIAHTEIGGWGMEAHDGRYDGKFLGAWKGKSVRELIWGQWTNGAAFRDLRQKAIDFYNNNKQIGEQLTAANSAIAGLKAQIDDLNKRPTADQLKALQDAATASNDKAMAAQAELEKAQAEKAADLETGNRFLRWIGSIFNKGGN